VSTSSLYFNPNDILSRPSEWTELSLNQALLRIPFMPVVSVFPVGATLRAQLLQNVSLDLSTYGPSSAPTRFFTQVAPNHSTAAQGVVPSVMSLSEDGATFIEGWESTGGYDETTQLYFPYDDKDPQHKPIGGRPIIGFATIGYGHLIGSEEDFSKGITLDGIRELFVRDTASRVKKLNKNLKVRVSQRQFDALLDLAFNAGNAITPPIRQLNAGKAVIEKDFTSHYITSKGVKMAGLVKRRKSEWILFSQGVYDSRH
jgi:lysozyme